MTDFPPRSPLPDPPGDEADLLASLYLDNEASSEERARVEADPVLMAKVDQFRMIAAENADVAVPAGLADRHIAAALDAFDGLTADAADVSPAAPTEAPAAAPVTSLADRRAKRSSLPAWLGAAAVLTLVIGGLGVIATRGSGGDDEVASIETSMASGSAEGSGGEMNPQAAPEADLAESADVAGGTAAEVESDGALSGDDMAENGMADNDGVDESIEEEGLDRQGSSPEEAAAFYLANGPVDLSDLEGTTAADYYDQLGDLPLQPIEASPCADSPLIAGLAGIDSFFPVIFEQQQASLVVQAGFAETALIVGPTCEIVLS